MNKERHSRADKAVKDALEAYKRPVDEAFNNQLPQTLEPERTYTVSLSVLMSEVNDVLAVLPEKEAEVLRLRFGTEDGTIRTQKEAAAELGVSRSTIGRRERSALKRLKKTPIKK